MEVHHRGFVAVLERTKSGSRPAPDRCTIAGSVANAPLGKLFVQGSF